MTLEVVEHVLKEDAELLVVRALDELLRVLPRDRAVVLELRDAGLEDASVDVEVVDLARPVACLMVRREALAPREQLPRSQVGLDCSHGRVVQEPLALHSVQLGEGVVEALIEAEDLWSMRVQVPQSLRENRPVCPEVALD